MTYINLTASSQTFACESCGHINIVPNTSRAYSTADVKKVSAVEPQSQQGLLEQVDLPPVLGKEPSTVSKLAAEVDDLNVFAAANAAADGKLVQHVEELHQHQAAHPPHHTIQRRASHLNPTLSGSHGLSHLSRSSSTAESLPQSPVRHNSQVASLQSEHTALEQADLPPALAKQPSAVSKLAAETDDLDAIAAANAARDGKLEQHMQELHMHQAGHTAFHQTPSRRSSRLNPTVSGAYTASNLSRASSDASDLGHDTLPQQSGPSQLHPPAAHLADQLAEDVIRTTSGSAASASPSRAASMLPNSSGPSRGNSGAPSNGGENGTVVFSLRGPTEVILAQMKMNAASTGSIDSLSGASWRSHSTSSSPHRHTQSGTPKTGMFNVSYPGAAPNLGRASMAGPSTAVEGPNAEGSSGTPKQTRTDMFTCPICFEELHKDDVFVSSMCGHEMCRGCARQLVLTAISQLEFPLACPVCKAGPSPACVHCEEVVRGHTNERYCSIDPDVQLVLAPEEYEDYMDKSMKFASNRDSELTSCPKPDCQGMAVVLSREPIFLCPLCNYAWCRRCKCDWHSFKTCDQYQRDKISAKPQETEDANDKTFQAWLKENRTIACPTCGQGLQKQEGCNHLQCTSCKSHVCWLCGKQIEAKTYWEAYTHYWDESSPCYGGTYDARMDQARVEG